MITQITWYTQKDMAKALGVCVNTFKRDYRPRFPPDKCVGQRLYWTQKSAQSAIEQIMGQSNPPPCPPTTA